MNHPTQQPLIPAADNPGRPAFTTLDADTLAHWLASGAIEPRDIPPNKLQEIGAAALQAAELTVDHEALEERFNDLRNCAAELAELLDTLNTHILEALATPDEIVPDLRERLSDALNEADDLGLLEAD